MLDLNNLRADPQLSENGVWAEFYGARFLIRRYNNPHAEQARTRLTMEKWDLLSSGGPNSVKVHEDIEVTVLASEVLRGWEGVGLNGTPVEYSPEAAKEFLADPSLVDLRQFIQNFSFNRGNFKERAESEIADSVKGTAAS